MWAVISMVSQNKGQDFQVKKEPGHGLNPLTHDQSNL